MYSQLKNLEKIQKCLDSNYQKSIENQKLSIKPFYNPFKELERQAMKKTHTEFGDFAPRTGSEELGLLSGLFILAGMVIISIIIADVATGFNLHNLLAGLIK